MNLDSGAEMPTLMVSTLQLMQRDLSKMPQDSGMRRGKCKCESCRCADLCDNADNSHFGSPFAVKLKLVLGHSNRDSRVAPRAVTMPTIVRQCLVHHV